MPDKFAKDTIKLHMVAFEGILMPEKFAKERIELHIVAVEGIWMPKEFTKDTRAQICKQKSALFWIIFDKMPHYLRIIRPKGRYDPCWKGRHSRTDSEELSQTPWKKRKCEPSRAWKKNLPTENSRPFAHVNRKKESVISWRGFPEEGVNPKTLCLEPDPNTMSTDRFSTRKGQIVVNVWVRDLSFEKSWHQGNQQFRRSWRQTGCLCGISSEIARRGWSWTCGGWTCHGMARQLYRLRHVKLSLRHLAIVDVL